MIYLVVISAISGAVVTLLLQLALLYRRKPEARLARNVQYVRTAPDPALRAYLSCTEPVEPCLDKQGQQQQGQEGPGVGVIPGTEPVPVPTAAPTPVPSNKAETCAFLNAIFLFLFRELRDSPPVRHWITKKIRVEFEELLQTKTAGRLLEGLSLVDISLGNSLPIFKTARLMKPVSVNPEGVPEELNLEVDLDYSGGFHLAIDVDLVFGKSAYLFVKITRVAGRLRLQFTRQPFTHWSFSFLEDPLIDFEVKSQFEGRPLPQLTSIIVNQLKRVIKKKHTLPNYKIRYKPFFPFQVQPTPGVSCDPELSLQDMKLVEGRLRVTLVECSRLFMLGSYDRETYVHCTVELSSHEWKEKTRTSTKKTEILKGPNGNVGMTFRHVPATEGDAVHVSIETVALNSPAAHADLQRGDRLIAIGGVKVTSSVQVLKLLKQAGDRVTVLYERPVRHQVPAMGVGPLQENLQAPLEEPGFPPAAGYEEDPAHITTVEVNDGKDNDSEIEDLISEPKLPAPPAGGDIKEESLLSVNQSPKKTVATLASKPLGTISPILNRKLNLAGLQSPLKPQPKESPKPSPQKTVEQPEPLQRPTVPPPPPPMRPPVPPRPQLKVTSASSGESQSTLESSDSSVEKSPEKILPPASNGDKSASEKTPVKAPEPKPAVKLADPADELPTATLINSKPDSSKPIESTTMRDSLDEQGLWESSEVKFCSRYARWSKSSVVFDVESNHKYLNIALWCKDPFKLGSLLCLGHVSLRLEHIALECLSTSSAEYQSTFRLCAPEPRASVSRTALRSLSTHKGFNEKLCYGDITLNFTYLGEGESDLPSGLVEREGSLHDEEPREREKEREQVQSLSRDDLSYNPLQINEVRHNFQDTQFQNPTWCDYCKKKVWTKAASQCIVCMYVCHKKCQEKCLAEHPNCLAIAERRSTDPEAKSTINRATTGLTRHIINTSSRLLNLRQVPKARLTEQASETGPGAAEPSPKHTPNTSDNESSDTETYAGASPAKQPVAGSGTKLARKEGGLDDSVFIAVKEIGRDLYRGLPTDERSQKLELMLDKLQQEIDQELEHNNSLLCEERETTDARRKTLITSALAKSGERLQALTLLMIHYRAGIEDLESVESTSPSEQQGFPKSKSAGLEEDLMGADISVYDSDICSPVDVQILDEISEEQICVEALPR